MSHKTYEFSEITMVVGLFLIVFVIGADSFIISPLLPAIEKSFRVSLGKAALSITIYALCYAIGSPFFGPLGDKFNKKKLLIIGIGIFLVGSVLCALAKNIAEFYLFRAVAGIGAALTMPNVWATIGTNFNGKKLNIVMGITMSALSLSIAIGVPLGTLLSQISNWHMAFGGSSVVTILAYIFLILMIPNMSVNKKKILKYLDSFKKLLASKRALVVLMINLIWMFGFYTIYTFLGTFLHQTLRLNTAQMGDVFIVYGLSNFAASFFGGYVMTRIGAMKSVSINGLCSVIFILGLTVFSNNITEIVTFLILLAFVQGLGVTALTTYIVNVIPQNRSTVMSFNSAFLYLGLTLGSAFGAISYPQIGYCGLGISSALALIVAVCLTVVIDKSSSHQ